MCVACFIRDTAGALRLLVVATVISPNSTLTASPAGTPHKGQIACAIGLLVLTGIGIITRHLDALIPRCAHAV
ncbi:MAG: hypothetical protein LBC51_02725 [Treponema sp.]|nr:hypothetical protein [Treponema sp.]